MKKQKQAFRVGSLSILLAVLLRMICSGALGQNVALFSQPQLAAFLVFSETGREPQNDPAADTAPDVTTQPTTTAPTTAAPIVQPNPDPAPDALQLPTQKAIFTEDDMEYLTMNIECKRSPNVTKLLTQPLNWDLTGNQPTILIIHTHGTEAYTPTPGTEYEEYGGEYRTMDDRYNMISIGDELTRLLEEAGLKVIHDRTAYDYNDYLDSYDNSRKAVQKHLQEHPTIKMVIDLHRDAAQRADGTQWAATGTVDGESAAKVMMVIGTNAMGLTHPNWETNLSIGEKLTVLMERNHDGMARDLNLRSARFNQDLAMGAIIAEVGAAGNTHEEALRGVRVLAEAIVQLALGSQ